MSRWEVVFAVACAVLVVVVDWGFPLPQTPQQLRIFSSLFLIAFYLLIVIFAGSERKPRMSMFVQTMLGGVLGIAIAAIFHQPLEGYAAAAGVGLVFGYFADMMAKWL